MKYQIQKSLTSKQKTKKKKFNTEKDFWNLFHEVHNSHLSTNVGVVTINVKKKN